MKVVALISGGKDSCFNMMHCIQQGHEIVALANLKPEGKDELDSYMYQTVGHDALSLYSDAIGLPLYRRTIKGSSFSVGADYQPDAKDEVEDLYLLLEDIKKEIDFDAVSSGAILSNYQRVRVENVCDRLCVTSLAYLWQRNQEELLEEMITSNLTAILIKVASLGLKEMHLGKSLGELKSHLHNMNGKYGLNVCGEGGEYETLVLDCPLFIKKLVIDEFQIVKHSKDEIAPVAYLTFQKLHLEDKPEMDSEWSLAERMAKIQVAIPPLLPDHVEIPQISHDNIEITNILFATSLSSPMSSFSLQQRDGGIHGWIAGLSCLVEDGKTLSESARDMWNDCLSKLATCSDATQYTATSFCLVHIFCRNMNDFGLINVEYKKLFRSNPPARVCVEVLLPEEEHFRVDAHLVNPSTGSSVQRREALHVQSTSYWAPANIGPYSQAVKLHSFPTKKVFFSGSIPLQPASMTVLGNHFEREAILSLKHVNEVSKIIAPERRGNILCRHYGSITCYVTGRAYMSVVKEIFESHQEFFDPKDFLLVVADVPRLPRDARVEWHVSMVISEAADDDSDGDGDGIKKDDDVRNYFLNHEIGPHGNTLFSDSEIGRKLLRDEIDSPFCRLFVAGDTDADGGADSLKKLLEDLKPKTAVSVVPVAHLLNDAPAVAAFDLHRAHASVAENTR